MAEAVSPPGDRPLPTRPASAWRRVLRWGGGIVAALFLALVGGVLILDSPLGERFIASRIAKQTFPNGLTITIGRIEGNIYGEAVLRDIRLSDPRGVFLTIPRAEIDWHPSGWLRNRLDIDSLVARRAVLRRLPEFLPSTEDKPILPGFDIAIDRFEIDRLTLAPGVAGVRSQRVDARGSVLVENRRLKLDADARLGQRDRLVLRLDAEPDGNDFDLAADLTADEGGPLALLAGLERGYAARIRGAGTWQRWDGALVARSEATRVAALKLTARAGRFGAVGLVDPGDFASGTLGRALGSDVALKADVAIAERVFDGSVIVLGSGAQARALGKIDLAANRIEGGNLDLTLTDPRLFGDGVRLEGARLVAALDGGLDDLAIRHELSLARLVAGDFIAEGLRQRGLASWRDGRLTLPLDLELARARSGQAWIDPRLSRGRAKGTLVLTGSRLAGEDLRVEFPGLSANLALSGDLASGGWRVAGPVRAERLVLEDVGTAAGTAMVEAVLARGVPWRLAAQLDGQVGAVSNATLANLAGPRIRVRGGIATGGNAPLVFRNLRADAAKLTLTLDGQVRAGVTTLAGRGRHSTYGPFTLDARVAAGGPEATLVFARPNPYLDSVRLALRPEGDGFAIAARGQSVLGPFDGVLGLTAPRGGPVRIAVQRMTVSDTTVSGALALEAGGVRGMLAFAEGGVDGTIALEPRGNAQGLAVDLAARNARFGGATPLVIARADISGQGSVGGGRTSFAGEGSAQGVSYGTLFIGRLAARGAVEDGSGRIDASLSGRRGARFSLDTNVLFRPGSIALAARGDYAGRRIATPSRVVASRLEDGGWQLAPSLVLYGDGGVLAEGRIGGGSTELSLQLARMDLSALDAAAADSGLGGTVSGLVEWRQQSGGVPTGSARVKIDHLTRSGLLLTSRPIDVALVARLDSDSLEAQARLDNADIRRGQAALRITDLPAAGPFGERLRAGRLDARLGYNGAAESLWRLAAVDAFDITGPVALRAVVTGTLAEPLVRGAVSSDNLRILSSLSGTDIRQARVRGRFGGSRLRLLRMEGTAGSGTVAGTGTIDLAGLGERIEGGFVEVRGPSLDLRIAARNARLLDTAGIGATVTGPLRIVSDGLGGTIAGRVTVERANWRLGTASQNRSLPRIATREINAPPDRAPRVAAGRAWRYLIDATADDRIMVEGMGLDSEWGANVRLRGTTEEPRIGGSARVVDGEYTFAGTSFELTRGAIAFDQNVAIDPRLDIRAESSQTGLDVVVRVTGSASLPEIDFSSTPALPEEEILARLLFGGSITSLSATDALQLGAALASLRGGAGIDPINRLRTAIGLDRLRIVSADPALGRGTGIAIGKNITRRIYVELVSDGQGYSATDVEFRVTSWLSLLASVSTVGRESVVAEISRDY